MMTGLTQDILSELKAPFPLDDHELRAGGFSEQLVYLTEEPLADRLSEVDPNWEFKIVSTIITDYNLSRPDSCTVTADLTICGITRSGVGTCVANVKLGEKKDGKWVKFETPLILPLSETEIKGAATDALKRCARLFGVGGYLLRLKGVKIRNANDFANWYKRELYAGAPERSQQRKTAPPARDSAQAGATPLDVGPIVQSALDDTIWTREKSRLMNLRDKAAGYWDVAYVHAYNRLAIIIGSELRPKKFPDFAAMMENECTFSAAEMWARVEAYEPMIDTDPEVE